MTWLADIIDSMDMSLNKLREKGKDKETQHAAAHEIAKSDMTEATERTHILSVEIWHQSTSKIGAQNLQQALTSPLTKQRSKG